MAKNIRVKNKIYKKHHSKYMKKYPKYPEELMEKIKLAQKIEAEGNDISLHVGMSCEDDIIQKTNKRAERLLKAFSNSRLSE